MENSRLFREKHSGFSENRPRRILIVRMVQPGSAMTVIPREDTRLMITEKMLTEVIESMPPPFDSHQVIIEVAHRNQRAYIEQLYANHAEAPFQAVHATLGIQINKICLGLHYTGKAHRSNDIFGRNANCVRYCKPSTSSQ
jgi:hypothetical protein